MTETTSGWAKRVYDLYAEGAWDVEVAADLKITTKEFYQHMADNDKFSTLVEFGRTMSQAWWEKQARLNVKNKHFNTPLYIMSMKNRYGWADKVDSTSTNENLNTNIDDLRQKVSEEFEKFRKRYAPELTDAKRLIEGIQSVEADGT